MSSFPKSPAQFGKVLAVALVSQALWIVAAAGAIAGLGLALIVAITFLALVLVALSFAAVVLGSWSAFVYAAELEEWVEKERRT